MRKSAYKKGGQAGKKVMLSLAVWVGILIGGALAFTSLVLAGKLGEEMVQTASMVLLFGGTVMGAVIASAGDDGWWLPLSAFGAIEYLLLTGCNIMAFDAGFERIGIGTLIVLGGVATAVALKFIPISRPRKKKYKHHFR